jgi:hypothetical protein
MGQNENFPLSQGSALVIPAVLRDPLGNPITTDTGAEALTTTVWPGGSAAPSFAPATTWVSPAAGTITIAITSAQTVGLDPGRYQLLTRVTPPGGDPVDGYACTLDVAAFAGAGAGAAPTSYGSFADLLDRAPWLEKLQRPTDLAGFARQRHLARKWFEDLLHRHYRGASGLLGDFAFVPGLSFGGRPGDAISYRDGRRSSDLQSWLDAGGLDVTEQVIDAVSCYAIALLCDRQIAPGKDDNGYPAAAARWFARAEDAALNITAEIDTNGDSVNDLTIRLGTYDTLEA